MTDATMLANKHTVLGFKCLDCHNTADLQVSHKNVTSSTKVPPTTYPQAFCLKCHGTYADLAKLTINFKGLKDANGTVVNPHALPVNDSHTTGKVTECSNCHTVHAGASDATTSAFNYCLGCHHAQVFECGTCHQM
jgi:hypothetical protein